MIIYIPSNHRTVTIFYYTSAALQTSGKETQIRIIVQPYQGELFPGGQSICYSPHPGKQQYLLYTMI